MFMYVKLMLIVFQMLDFTLKNTYTRQVKITYVPTYLYYFFQQNDPCEILKILFLPPLLEVDSCLFFSIIVNEVVLLLNYYYPSLSIADVIFQ